MSYEYKVITSSKTFLTDHLYSKHLKEENGVFYAREFSFGDWQELMGIYTTPVNNFFHKLGLIFFPIERLIDWIFYKSGFLFPIMMIILLFFYYFIIFMIFIVPFFFFFLLFCFLISYLCKFVEVKTKPNPYIIKLSDEEIYNIIKKNFENTDSIPHTNSRGSRNSSHSGNSHYRGGSVGNGTPTINNVSVSSKDIEKALKKFKSVGKDWGELVNDTTDEDRKKLFTEYFKDANKGEAANNKFIREQAWPAREHTLKKILEESDYEDLETKEKFEKQIENLSGKISNSDFQKIATEIREYQERKRLKDNHIKFEGRLSNNDIQKIKDYLGYVCMGCGLNPVKEYGEQMKGILEAHHKRPWGELQEDEVRTVTPNDFYILCPNCHRIIHKLSSPDDIDKLREILRYHKAHK